ncbi:MAG TPA: S9 family peptidase [Xanthomonadales bacterium]|nr:S9 family peptidase [Xanthomonadales bacterium]
MSETSQQNSASSDTPEASEPMAEKRPHELTIHGDTRIDEYYWLRDDTRSDPEVLAYLESENEWFKHEMAHTEVLQETLFEEMTGRLDPVDAEVPYEKGGYWYYSRYEPGQDYAVHARRKGSMEAEEEILIDANQRAEGHEYYNLGNLVISDDQRYAAVVEDTVGRRIYDIRFLDTETGEFLPDRIGNAAAGVAWSADDKYLFYMDKHLETLLGYRLMRHEIGTEYADDELVYQESDNRFYNQVSRSRSGDYIFLAHLETESSEYKVLAANDPLGEFKVFLPREEDHLYFLDHAGDTFYIRTNWEAENYRVMTSSLSSSQDKSSWDELIPARKTAMVQGLQAFDNWLVVGEREDGLRKVRVMSLDGETDRYLDAGMETYVMWPETNVSTETSTIRYGISSLNTPEQIWAVDLESGETELLKATRILGGFDSLNYRTGRMMVTVRDGTAIPVSLAYHKDTPLDGTAPAYQTAYGSYGASSDPYFRNSIVSLMDRGFVYLIAHIRGGQEMGRQWYEQGRLMNKKNSFTDFIDVTAGLQEQGIIDPSRTFAQGGSAGGLLMGAVINMAPELYAGVVADVPFVDVVTTMLDESIPLTSGEWNEWGNPKEKDAYDYMLSYSPYDQVSEQDYPNLMVTTGLHDSQVQYFEPAKWVARLRDRRTDDNRLVFHVNMDAGHGGSSGRLEGYRDLAREFAFVIDLAALKR